MQHRLHIRPARKQTPPLSRHRVLYAGLALAMVVCGLLWCSGLIPLPPVVSKYGGDALWPSGTNASASVATSDCVPIFLDEASLAHPRRHVHVPDEGIAQIAVINA